MRNTIFCDGACLGNPGPGGWGTIVYIASKNDVLEIGGAEPATTNNRMELRACLEGLRLLGPRDKKEGLSICTDSRHLIDSVTQWIDGWVRRHWKTAQGENVKNRDLWEAMIAALAQIKPYYDIEWVYVPGHRGIPGNERCDEIASSFAIGNTPQLYKGSAQNYTVDLTDMTPKVPKTPTGGKHYYLSVTNGEIHRDVTWAECEKRVKGKTGAKFKKCSSALEEEQILKAWGIKL